VGVTGGLHVTATIFPLALKTVGVWSGCPQVTGQGRAVVACSPLARRRVGGLWGGFKRCDDDELAEARV
jgi:hypothetical protein